MRRVRVLAFAALGAFAFAACGPQVDLQRGLQVEVVSTGWNATPASGGQSKIVPVIAFKLKNISSARIGPLQVNAVFHRVGDDSEWGSGFVPGVGADGIAAGTDSPPVTVASPLGYTGADPTTDLLKNTHFVDVQVRVYVKSGSAKWTPLGEYPIARRLVTAGSAN